VEGDLYVSGSITLVRAMLADGPVDDLHLCVYPLTRESAPRLFTEDAAPAKLSLTSAESYDNGVLYLNYRTEGTSSLTSPSRIRLWERPADSASS
jgi:dihydrofolate reductase